MFLKLTIELVPESSWAINLRNRIGNKNWREISMNSRLVSGNKCGICGRESDRLQCHEMWKYDDKNHVQTLVGFIALCPLCHHVKHIGFASVLASRGQLNLEVVIQHFMRVNNCDRETYREHRRQAFALWRERSKYDWIVKTGKYKEMMNGG